MNHATHSLFVSTIERVNAAERQQREDYYRYLLEKGDKSDTFDAYMAKYANFARFGQPASLAAIDSLRRLSGPALPKSLVDFFLALGAFDSGERLSNLVIHSAPELLAMSQPESPNWNRIRSIGLVEMILLSWGGDRFEFDPATGAGLRQAEVLALNRNYSVIGWHTSDFGEAYTYLYFDAQEKFGIVRYHQDDFDYFYTEHVVPMTQQSSAHMTLDEALAAMLESAEAAAHEYDDEDDS